MKISLKVMNRKESKDGVKSKPQHVGDFKYMGPFTLFSELYGLIEDFSGNNIKYSNNQMTNLQEILNYSLDNRLLQVNVPNLRLQRQEIFWNLIYLFINEKIDYKFICPYEADLPDDESPDFSGNRAGSSKRFGDDMFAFKLS